MPARVANHAELPPSLGWLGSRSAALTWLAASLACAVSAADLPKEGPVWPSPPAEARLRYAGSLGGPADIGQARSLWSKVSGLVSGGAATSSSLDKPFGLAVDEQGNLAVSDSGDASICFVDFGKKTWAHWDTVGKTRLRAPVALALGAGVVYVADSELAKVFAFRDPKQVLFEIGAPLQRPAGLALAEGSLFVVDPPAHTVRAFDLRGQQRFQFGTRGAGPGEFNFPTHIAADGRGKLYVTDALNCRVEVFDLTGKFLREIGSAGDASGHFSRPKGVVAGPSGRVFVVDALFDNVQLFDAEGRLLLYWGEAGAGPGEFWLPNGIALASRGRLFVADTFNHRVQLFDLLGEL